MRFRLLEVAGLGVACLLCLVVAIVAVAPRLSAMGAHRAPPSGTMTQLPAIPSAGTLVVTDPRELVLTPADLGPGYVQIRSTPAVLKNLSSDANGWDSVLHSTLSGSLVESIAVIYPSEAEAVAAANQAAATSATPGSTQVVGASGRVMVVVVVVPGHGDDSSAIAARASAMELSRVESASR